MITPADWDRGYQIHRGATFNLAHNLSQMLHLRPRTGFEIWTRCTWSGVGRTREAGCRSSSSRLASPPGSWLRTWEYPAGMGAGPGRGEINAVRNSRVSRGGANSMKDEQASRVGVIGGGLGGRRRPAHSPPGDIASSCWSGTAGSGARRLSWKSRAIASTWARRS